MLQKIFQEKNKKLFDQPNRYFDYQATTPIDPRVLDAMMPYLTTNFGNPHSRTHSFGWTAEKGLEKGRENVASLINADTKDIIFTSGATEANNLALKGFAEYHNYDLHIITQQTEHKAILEPCRYLEDKGVKITYLPVQKNGKICLKQLRNAITPKTKLISIMAVNNEQGVIQPLNKIGKICKEHNIVFHTDAAQAFGKMELDVKEDNIGMMSISGHKIYGPKGIGALYIRRNPRVRITKQMHGGSQERGLRCGTVPVFLTVGLGKAAEIAKKEMKEDSNRLKKLNEKFLSILREKLGDEFIKNGDDTLSTCINLSFPYVEGEGLLMKLKDFALSSGSACTSSSLEPSYVLRAMGSTDDLAHSSIRFGFGRFTKEKEVEELANKTAKAVIELREMSPLYEMVKNGMDLSEIKWSA
ncbi:NFS1 [Ecytonucleospora hepatopenaei]|uniref:Cysteine desulfurase, mitosomal n=1 Tax=Ecytonucleospora hepatopenaei TaxID=646526 RepID=A0A1W0E9B0_9MICR|nr:NFS1 [Ecytonucleospora hepatopenaei]